jgi:hypothetical protein
MSRASWITVVFVLIMAVGALVVHREFRNAQERPALQRELSEMRLRQFATAIAAYRERHQAWPDTLFTLMKDARLPFGAHAVRGTGLYGYRPPPPGSSGDFLIMASSGFHAGIRADEPWDGPGAMAASDLPPVAYVLTADLRILKLDPAERDRRWSAATIPPSPAAP